MVKKKITSIIFVVLTAALLSGCGGDSNGSTNNSDKVDSSKNVNIEEPAAEDKETPPILIDQIKVNMSIRKPDSIGTRYVDATLTNNSSVPIKFCNITIFNKDINENSYLVFTNTLMPNETSPKTNAFAPKTGKKEDIEIIKYEFTLVGEDGKDIYLDYDPKLKTYEWH